MRCLLAIGMALTFAGPCLATDAIHLACAGDLYIRGQVEKHVFSMAIDLESRAVTIQGYDPVPMFGDTSRETVAFMARPGSLGGVSTGTLNRMTGATSVHIISQIDGLLIFEGLCKPTQRLF
jgi:hypothetical protein